MNLADPPLLQMASACVLMILRVGSIRSMVMNLPMAATAAAAAAAAAAASSSSVAVAGGGEEVGVGDGASLTGLTQRLLQVTCDV